MSPDIDTQKKLKKVSLTQNMKDCAAAAKVSKPRRRYAVAELGLSGCPVDDEPELSLPGSGDFPY